MKKGEIICPKYTGCPIFQKQVLDEQHSELYRRLYCTAGYEKFTQCKRYIVSEKTKVPPPPDVLPNSILSVEEIITDMKLQGLIKDEN